MHSVQYTTLLLHRRERGGIIYTYIQDASAGMKHLSKDLQETDDNGYLQKWTLGNQGQKQEGHLEMHAILYPQNVKCHECSNHVKILSQKIKINFFKTFKLIMVKRKDSFLVIFPTAWTLDRNRYCIIQNKLLLLSTPHQTQNFTSEN